MFKATSSSRVALARRGRERLTWGAALLGLAVACSSKDPPAPPAGSSSSGETRAPSSPLPLPSASGPHWERAASSLDPLDLAEVGRIEGGAGLAAALGHPRFGAVARAALPGVPDAMLAAAPLAARARAGRGAEALAELDTLIEVLRARVVMGERLDPEGEDLAIADLLAVANDEDRELALRARAVTALRLFAARGSFDEAKVPTGLDG